MKFIESIRLEAGDLWNLPLHQRRMDLTLIAHFGTSCRIDLANELKCRSLPASGLFKIRVTYGQKIEAIEIEPYARHTAQQVALVQADELDYRYKYANRTALDALRGEVGPGIQPLIVQHGLLTDAIYANLCFLERGTNVWLTPQRPLLDGVARAAALAMRQVVPAPVSVAEIRAGRFSHLKLINCMTLFHEAGEIPLSAERLVS